MSAMRWLRALLGNTKAEAPAEPQLTAEQVVRIVADELMTIQAKAALEAEIESDAKVPPPAIVEETPKLQCACGATAMRVDQVQQALRYVDGRLQLVPDGATLTCPRCGRGFAVDPRGQFDPHRAAWPSSWVVADELDRRKADLDAKLASRGAPGKQGRRLSPVSDMRRPPA